MKPLILALSFLLSFCSAYPQNTQADPIKIEQDLDEILTDLSQNYVYLEDKNVDLDCIRDYYRQQIPSIKTEEETVLFFEYLLNEFYDSHLILNTNRSSSYRLYSPIYASISDGKPIISSVWLSQIKALKQEIIGVELLKINGTDIDKAVEQFPTHCNDKSSQPVREWIINKILAGRYNEPRILTLRLTNNEVIEFDLDKVELKKENSPLSVSKVGNIGIIRINNSLGQDQLVSAFDKALDGLANTQGLIIDLRNTVDGGDSYEARGIMGRFINEPKPYQMHQYPETSFDDPANNPTIERRWVEYVTPRGTQYDKSVLVLVGRWTGSMGEGLAIGFEGMERAGIVGTEMERLAGEMSGFSFRNQRFGYRLSTAKLFHVDGTPREQYVPRHYVQQTTVTKDEVLESAIALIKESGG